MATGKRSRSFTRSKELQNLNQFKQTYQRNPRKLTDRRKRLIQEYMKDSRHQDAFGTTQWITGLINLLKESKRNVVTPADVQEWMKNSDLFPAAAYQQHGLSSEETSVDSLRFSSELPKTSGNWELQPENHGESGDEEEAEGEKVGTRIVESGHLPTAPLVNEELSHNALGTSLYTSVDNVIVNANNRDVEPRQNSSGAEDNPAGETKFRAADFADLIVFYDVPDGFY